MKITNLHIKNPNTFAFDMFGLKCFFHLHTMLKPSKTTYPFNLFDYDCVTLYLFIQKLHIELVNYKIYILNMVPCNLAVAMAILSTALRNHMRIVFEEMSSWTPLTIYLGMKTTF